MAPARITHGLGGFTLVELLMSMSTGLLLMLAIAQVLLAETGDARHLGRVMRERLAAQRALGVIQSELEQAIAVSSSLPVGGHPGCGLTGRQIRLVLQLATGLVSYSVEGKPAAIWRGSTLMRCGPTYGLDGQLNPGTNQSTVLIDAVHGSTLSWQAMEGGVLLGLERSVVDGAGQRDGIEVSQWAPVSVDRLP